MGKGQTAKESKHQIEEFRFYCIGNGKTKIFKQENINQYKEAVHQRDYRRSKIEGKNNNQKGITTISM